MSHKYTFSPGGREARAADGLPRMDPWQKQQVFRIMAIHQLRQGRLSAGRRKRIVQYAASLGFSAVQSGRLLQEAQRLFERECEEDGTVFPRIHNPTTNRTHNGSAEPRSNGLEETTRGASESSNRKMVLAFVLGGVLLSSWLIVRLFS